jgi:hypothetical protein
MKVSNPITDLDPKIMYTSTNRWDLLHPDKDIAVQREAGQDWKGRKYYWDRKAKRLAVADWSGTTPDTTDDGVLWVDTKSPVTLTSSRDGMCIDAHCIVISERTEESYTMGLDAEEVEFLLNTWDLRIKIGSLICVAMHKKETPGGKG